MIFVLPRREVLPYPVVLELERELMVRDALREGEALPQYSAGGGRRVELQDLRADEEMVVLPGELPADVNRLVLQDGPVLFHSQRSLPHIPCLARKNPSFSRRDQGPVLATSRLRVSVRERDKERRSQWSAPRTVRIGGDVL